MRAQLGSLRPSGVPAPCGNDVAVAGMSTTTQCQKPAPPVGASGSCTMTAKLQVPAGRLRQVAAGDVFCPVQPKPKPLA